MNTQTINHPTQNQRNKNTENVSIRVSKDSQNKINSLLKKLNVKDLGRQIKSADVVRKALEELNDDHLKELQDESLSNADRLEKRYSEHCEVNGFITKDEYLGQLLVESESVRAVSPHHENKQ